MDSVPEQKTATGSSVDPDQTSVMKPVSPSHSDMMRLMAMNPAPTELNADTRKNLKRMYSISLSIHLLFSQKITVSLQNFLFSESSDLYSPTAQQSSKFLQICFIPVDDEDDVYSELGEDLYMTPIADHTSTSNAAQYSGAAPVGEPAGGCGMALTPAAFDSAVILASGADGGSAAMPDGSWTSSPAYSTTSFTTFADVHSNINIVPLSGHSSSESPPPPPFSLQPLTPVDITADHKPVPEVIPETATEPSIAQDNQAPLDDAESTDDLPPPPSPLVGKKPKKTPPATLPRPVKATESETPKSSRRRGEKEGAANLAAEAAAAALAKRSALRSATQKGGAVKKVWRSVYR